MLRVVFLLIVCWFLPVCCFGQSPTVSPTAEVVSHFAIKDWITFTASAFALFISILSFRQKASESRLALRKQLTDLFEKLTSLNTEFAKFRADTDDYPPNYPGLLSDQRRFLVRQAAFIASKIRPLVSPFEYLLLAGGHDDINDWSQAEHFFRLAISTASDAIDRGIATRGYGRYLYGHGRLDEARDRFAEALKSFEGAADRVRVFRADTLERWAGHEREWANDKEANRLLEEAIAEYRQLEHPVRRRNEIERVEAVISELRLSNVESAEVTKTADHIVAQELQQIAAQADVSGDG